MRSKCPPVTLNVDEVVEAAKKKVLESCPSFAGNTSKAVDADVHSVGVNGLGRIALVEDQVKPGQFVLGYVTIPTAVNFVTKLMQVGLFLPKADMAVSRGVAAGLTLVGTLISGGKSFLLGAFLGQFPSTLDALTDVAIAAIAKSQGNVQSMPTSEMKGLGAEADEIQKLREDLQKLSNMGTYTEYEGAQMQGVKFYH